MSDDDLVVARARADEFRAKRQPGFCTPLRLEKVAAQQWMLFGPLWFYSLKYDGVFVAPAGSVTDLASIPRGFWNVFPKVGLQDPIAAIHDAGYRNQLVTPSGVRIHTIKKVADDLFDEGLKAAGVSWLSRKLMVRMVRMFGDPLGPPPEWSDEVPS